MDSSHLSVPDNEHSSGSRMDPAIKAKWVAALRSGEYKQGRGQLRSEKDEFCCAGVLCNLHAMAHPEIAAQQDLKTAYMACEFWPEIEVWAWAGLNASPCVVIGGLDKSLASHNDGAKGVPARTFAEIADAIEAQL